MLKHKTRVGSKDINKLAEFIVDAITKNESEARLVKERSASGDRFERLMGLDEYRIHTESNSSRVKGKIALKAAMERWSKSP